LLYLSIYPPTHSMEQSTICHVPLYPLADKWITFARMLKLPYFQILLGALTQLLPFFHLIPSLVLTYFFYVLKGINDM